MTTLAQCRLGTQDLNALIARASNAVITLGGEQRRALSARFRAVADVEHRRLDAWLVERSGTRGPAFAWTPQSARRTLGTAALRRDPTTDTGLVDAVHSAIDDQVLRVVAGRARSGSLAFWLGGLSRAERGLVVAEALNWSVALAEVARTIAAPWRLAPNDAYYDVAAARTTLRGRRDLVVTCGDERVVLRLRSGAPGRSAGAGLRADLLVETLADPRGVAPARFVGVWPDAGVCLGVEGTIEDLRSGARDLLRTAIATRRESPSLAA